jgi:magnesium transporter
MRGSTFDSAIVVAVCTNGRLVGLASIELLLAAPADAVLADVMDIDAPVVAPGTASGAGRMASVEAGGTRSRGGQRIQPLPSPNPPQRLDGILLREHDEDLDRLGRFLASTPDARTASQETVGRRLWHRMPWLAVGLAGAMASAGPLAGIEDQMATNLAGPTSSSESCTWPMRWHPDATLAIRGLSVGVGIGRIARREARSPDCSSAAFSRPRCCPSSAGCGTIPHDVDVNTQIEAAVGGQGPSSRS